MDFLNAVVAFANFVLIPATAYGAQLALGALGVTLIYGILRFSNFAHGDKLLFGAMILFWPSISEGQGASLNLYNCTETATCDSNSRCTRGEARVWLGTLFDQQFGRYRYLVAYALNNSVGSGALYETPVIEVRKRMNPNAMIALKTEEKSFLWIWSTGSGRERLHYVHPMIWSRPDELTVVTSFSCKQEIK